MCTFKKSRKVTIFPPYIIRYIQKKCKKLAHFNNITQLCTLKLKQLAMRYIVLCIICALGLMGFQLIHDNAKQLASNPTAQVSNDTTEVSKDSVDANADTTQTTPQQPQLPAWETIPASEIVKGKASYYSLRMHGRGTASGEMYNKDSLMCAHLTLPFGTRLRVRNTANNKEIIIRVTDRGPYGKRFKLDLSTAAARELGFLGKGVADIEYTVLGDGPVYKMTPAERTAARAKWQAQHGTKKKSHKKKSSSSRKHKSRRK